MLINSDLKITNLRCEYKINPLGIDCNNPRLSWIIESVSINEYSQKQTAYQIIVSSSKKNLDKNVSDFWDSGKVRSDRQNQIEYDGIKLKSKDECWWKVKVWDKEFRNTYWSKPAKWTMGLLDKKDWKAEWIGYDKWEREKSQKPKFEFEEGKDKWIWFPLNKTENAKGIGEYLFRKKIFIKNIDKIKSAVMIISADEKFKLFLNGQLISQSDDRIFSWTRPKLLNIRSYLKNGKNIITFEAVNTYLDKPGLAVKLRLLFKDGKKEIIHSDGSWKSSKKISERRKENKFNDNLWSNSEIVAFMGEEPWDTPKVDLFLPPPPFIRKEFGAKKSIKKAFVFISALGIYELFINGIKISDDKFTPGWTDYNKRVYYNVYDIKKNINGSEKNCLGIILADGWYAGYIGWEKRREYYGKNPRVILQLEIEYEDGTKELIGSDKSWKATYGPILEADILMGETYDARKELRGWCKNNYDDSSWENAEPSDYNNIELNSYPGIPVRKTLEIKPVKINSPQKGIYIFDLGQNIAGCARLKINGKKSEKIVLRFGEMLDENGRLYTENIRMARAADTYYSKGESEEIWEPDFTYHGFRFVEVTGLNDKLKTDTITGIVFHSDLSITGSFDCSNKKLNKLYQNILWSQRSNFMDIPTDCPQRDERLGWTADAVDFIRTASFNMDCAPFYTKWLQDLNDAQEKNGAYTAIAPKPDLCVGPLYSGAAGFADAGIITPYYLYKYYDDVSILKKYYKNMQRFMNYLEINNFKRPCIGYGDWLSVNAETPQELIDAAFFAFDAKLMSEISLLIDRVDESKQYNKLYKKVQKYFVDSFVQRNGAIKKGTQTAYVLPLFFNILNTVSEKKAFEFLIKDIENRDWRASTGFIGLTYLFPVLIKFGRSDIVYKLLLNETFPSWLNMLNKGATTMWERWDSWSAEKGFYDPLMNSFNHTSHGVIGEWFYSGIGGIIQEEPGFKKIIIRPQFGGELSYAKTSYNSIIGKIIVDWKIDKNKLELKLKIPINCSAKIFLPRIIEGRMLIELESNNELEILMKDDKHQFELGSGEYLVRGSLSSIIN